ncbi:hypothetical protein [Methanoregula sp.]|uniref:hypothetical protein n=1 Tax=Methanoregula sp. TaxID=2052170 RepID=UPI000CB03E5A|nr:hypothetical protein [Methanoregula sp.]PKG33555.1 MAG: hypothetical protein CW742_02390 [Methanoregula sp.]
MKKLAYLLFFIAIAGVLLGITGFFSLPSFSFSSETKEPEAGTGFIILNESDPVTGISFPDTASRILFSLPEWEGNTTGTFGIRMIQGYRLDTSGNASSWDIIVCQEERSFLITYSRSGEKVYNWSGRCPEQEIHPDLIITPRELFLEHQERIVTLPDSMTTESWDLSLVGNTYYLTITGPGIQRELRFNATTGALISAND